MPTVEQQFQIAMARVTQAQLRAQYYAKRVENGVYKERVGKVRQGGHDGPLVTEEAILREEVHTMHRHITMADEHLEYAMDLLHKKDQENGR